MSTFARQIASTRSEVSVGSDMPEGWAVGRLPEIADITMGQSPPGSTYNKQKNGLPFFQGKADFGERFPTARVWCTSPNKIARPGDILISVRAPVGPTNVAKEICAIGRGLSAITPLGGIPTEFILLALRLQEPELSLSGTGSTFTAISRRDIDEITVNIPPLAEQKRIVAKIEDLLAQVSAARDRLAKVAQILKHFRQSVLAAACSGHLTEDWREKHKEIEQATSLVERIAGKEAIAVVPEDDDPIEPLAIPEEWVWSRCQSICVMERPITYGVIKLGPPVDGGVPTLRSSDVRWLQIKAAHIKRISSKIASEYSRTFLEGGEILVTVRGTLGGVAVVPPEMAGFNISREVAMIPLRPELDAEYFCYAMSSIWSQNWLSEVTKGVAYTGVNIRDLKRLPLPVPSLAEQHEIVRRVEALFELADAIEKRVEAARRRADKLTQAILAKAFRGELVPTEAELARREGRSYEPASALLARICCKRAAEEGWTGSHRIAQG